MMGHKLSGDIQPEAFYTFDFLVQTWQNKTYVRPRLSSIRTKHSLEFDYMEI